MPPSVSLIHKHLTLDSEQRYFVELVDVLEYFCALDLMQSKLKVLKALTVLVKNVPKQMACWLPQILPPVWATLTTSAEKYVREVVNEGGEEEDVVDSDGEVVELANIPTMSMLSGVGF